MSRLKYQVGMRFVCKVHQRLVMGSINGVPVPFGQVVTFNKKNIKCNVDIEKASIVVLEADFQCIQPDGAKKRAYVLRVENSPIFFMERVMTRKYEQITDLSDITSNIIPSSTPMSDLWKEAERAAKEVATWSPSKRMETVYRLDVDVINE